MKNITKIIAGTMLIASASYAQNRLVLIEQFSNSSCGPCGSASPTIYNYADNNPTNATVIAYHTSFPYSNDSMYHENPVDANARVNYYSVSGVPQSIVDGNVYNGGTANLNPNLNTTILNRKAVAIDYNVAFTAMSLVSNVLSGSVNFTSLSATNAAQNLVAHIVVVEEDVLKSSYAASPGNNSETSYGYVMRKMLPSASGTLLSNTQLQGNNVVNFNWTLSHIKNINEVRVIAFVQNTTTKEVYQAQIINPLSNTVGLKNISEKTNLFSVFPNPISNTISINFYANTFVKSIEFIDNLGRTIQTKNIANTINKYDAEVVLPAGIYYLKINTNDTTEYKKIIVSK